MFPKGVYIFAGIIVLRWVLLVLFLNLNDAVYINLYIATLFPMAYLILSIIFPKLDKFKLFQRKPIK